MSLFVRHGRLAYRHRLPSGRPASSTCFRLPLSAPSFKLYLTRAFTFLPLSSTHDLRSTHLTSAHEPGANISVSLLDSKLKSHPQAASATSFSHGLASVSTAYSRDIDASTSITLLPVGHSADTVDITHRSSSLRLRRMFDDSFPTNRTHAETTVGSK